MSGALFVGLDNPQSSDPRYALFPRPANCAGANLLKMMRMADTEFTERQYINIPKTNLFPVGRWPTVGGKSSWIVAAARLLVEQLVGSGSHVVLFGSDVRDAVISSALLTKPPKEMEWVRNVENSRGFNLCWLPHPSGRNRWYNARGRKKRVGSFLLEVVR